MSNVSQSGSQTTSQSDNSKYSTTSCDRDDVTGRCANSDGSRRLDCYAAQLYLDRHRFLTLAVQTKISHAHSLIHSRSALPAFSALPALI